MKPRRTKHQNASRDGLMPVHEVARRWNAISGQTISHGRTWQILRKAESKIARAMANYDTTPDQEKTR